MWPDSEGSVPSSFILKVLLQPHSEGSIIASFREFYCSLIPKFLKQQPHSYGGFYHPNNSEGSVAASFSRRVLLQPYSSFSCSLVAACRASRRGLADSRRPRSAQKKREVDLISRRTGLFARLIPIMCILARGVPPSRSSIYEGGRGPGRGRAFTGHKSQNPLSNYFVR